MTTGTTQAVQLIYQTAPQSQFRESPAWVRGFVAGRGSGKTLIGARDVLMRASAGEPWMSVSPSYGIIHETTMPTLVQEARKLGVFIRQVKNPLPRVTFRSQDGGIASIVFRSGEDPEKLRGPNKAGLWIDEASITHPDVFMIGMACLRHQRRMGSLVLTFTPKGRSHWTFDVFFELAQPAEDEWLEEDEEDRLWLCKFSDRLLTNRRVHTYSGLNYVQKPNTCLVHAKTRDNPFLPPEFFGNIRAHYSRQLAEQELEGEFVDIEGLMFRRSWFELVNEVPRDAQRVRYWDRAATAGAGSYSAGVLMARDRRGVYYIEDVVRGQWSAHERNQMMQLTAELDAKQFNNEVVMYVEQEGGSGGKEVAQQALVQFARHPVYIDHVTGVRVRRHERLTLPGRAKIVRAQPLAAQAEAGNVKLKRGKWNMEFLEELCAFPEYQNDDQVDATSGAFNKVSGLTMFADGSVYRTELAAREERRYGAIREKTVGLHRPSTARGSSGGDGAHRRPSRQ
ncbi:MAG: hypothetical protein FJ276_09060 [Planctomycetes bacterium]|nr:hypothetical protein [Planctomycetota bacterium]